LDFILEFPDYKIKVFGDDIQENESEISLNLFPYPWLVYSPTHLTGTL